LEESMKAGDLVKARERGALALVVEVVVVTLVAPRPAPRSVVHILLNDGRRIWVGASMLEVLNATG